MKFDLYEQKGGKDGNESTSLKKRILKGKLKAIKYQASSFTSDSRAKMQGSDYYVGVFDS